MLNKKHPSEWAVPEGEALSNGCGAGRGVYSGDCYDDGNSFEAGEDCNDEGFSAGCFCGLDYGIAEPSTGKMNGGGTMRGRGQWTGEGVG